VTAAGSRWSEQAGSASNEARSGCGVRVIGICYGLQFIVHHLGGKVAPAPAREYGHAEVNVIAETPLFHGLPQTLNVWMSHGDEAKQLPAGFSLTAKTSNALAGIANEERRIWAVQFHPEVAHTRQGMELLRNFVLGICGAKPDWTCEHFIQSTVERIRAQVGKGHAICGLSGGVDSSVAAVLVAKAIGDRLTCIFVNNGVLRKDEFAKVQKTMREKLGCASSLPMPAIVFSQNSRASPTPNRSARSSATNSLRSSTTKQRKYSSRSVTPEKTSPGSSRVRSTPTSSSPPPSKARRRPSRATTTSAACPRT